MTPYHNVITCLAFSLTIVVIVAFNSECCYKRLHISFVSVEYNSLNSLVSEAFIRFFLETIGHYSLFITEKERGERVFQREAFRKSVASKSIRRFLGVFMESQMFAGFIQDRELRKTRAKGSFSKIPHQSLKRARSRCSNTDP